MKTSLLRSALAAMLLGSVHFARAAVIKYQVTDLGAGAAYAINSHGQVTGQFVPSGDASIWTPTAPNGPSGISIDLGNVPSGSGSVGYGINDSGQVTGATTVTNGAYSHTFLYSGGVMQDLGSLPNFPNSYGYDINASGQITGYAVNFSQIQQAFLYSGGVMTSLGTLPDGGPSFGFGINVSGQVAGGAQSHDGHGHAFIYSGGTMHDLGVAPGYVASAAESINANGHAAGSLTDSNFNSHAALYNGISMIDLGTLPGFQVSDAWSLNNTDVVVGELSTASADVQHAFIDSGGKMTDLNTLINSASGWVLESGEGINDFGQIAGWGTLNGVDHAFLLTPVPEPSSLALFALSIVGLLCWRLRSPRLF